MERGADLHMAELMPLPLTVSCFSKIQIGFTFLVPAHLGSPGHGPLNVCVRARARVCARVCVCARLLASLNVLVADSKGLWALGSDFFFAVQQNRPVVQMHSDC